MPGPFSCRTRRAERGRGLRAIPPFRYEASRPAIEARRDGRLAQLVERLLYTERVGGSSPSPPTMFLGKHRFCRLPTLIRKLIVGAVPRWFFLVVSALLALAVAGSILSFLRSPTSIVQRSD
jgi:hypothetical protein